MNDAMQGIYKTLPVVRKAFKKSAERLFMKETHGKMGLTSTVNSHCNTAKFPFMIMCQ